MKLITNAAKKSKTFISSFCSRSHGRPAPRATPILSVPGDQPPVKNSRPHVTGTRKKSGSGLMSIRAIIPLSSKFTQGIYKPFFAVPCFVSIFHASRLYGCDQWEPTDRNANDSL